MTSSAPDATEYLAAPNQVISAANGIDYLLAGLIPQARVKIYPDAAHRVPVPAPRRFRPRRRRVPHGVTGPLGGG